MARNRSRAARPGRFETKKRAYVLSHQLELPSDDRHKYEATIFRTGRVLIRAGVLPQPGPSIPSQLGILMRNAMFSGPFLPEGEIRLRRFGTVSIGVVSGTPVSASTRAVSENFRTSESLPDLALIHLTRAGDNFTDPEECQISDERTLQAVSSREGHQIRDRRVSDPLSGREGGLTPQTRKSLALRPQPINMNDDWRSWEDPL